MAAIMNYNGRGDVSSAHVNAALGAITNVTRTYIYTLCSRASATRRKAELCFVAQYITEIKVVNHASKACS